MPKPKRPPNPPASAKRDAASLPSTSSSRSATILGWFAFLACIAYSFAFYRATLGESTQADGSPLALTRLHTLFMWLVPEETWRIWANDYTMPIGILDRIPILLATSVWLAIAHYLGGTMLQLCQFQFAWNRMARSGLSFAIGLQLLSWITMSLGMLGLLRQAWLLAITLSATIAIAWYLRRRLVSHEPVPPQDPVDPSPSRRWAWLAVVGIIMGVLIYAGAVLPPIEFDVREYHLQAPKEFALQGRIAFLPHNVYANMPLGSEMHSLAWMVLLGSHDLQSDGWYFGAIIGKMIVASYSLIAAMIIGGLLAREAQPLSGWVAAIAYLASPGIAEVSRLGLIDATLGCYVVAIFACMYIAWRQQSWTWGRCIVTGWLLGAAIGCKYTAIPMIAIPALATWLIAHWHNLGSNLPDTLAKASVMLAVTLASGGGWYLKNGLLIGNPVYPLAGEYFSADPRTPAQIEQWNAAHRVPPIANTPDSSGDYRPQRLLQDLITSLVTSRYLGAMLVPLAILGWCSRRNRLNSLSLGWVLWMFLCWWVFTHRLDRFLLPIYPLVALGAGLGVASCSKFLRGYPLDFGLVLGSLYAIQLVATIPISDVRILVKLDALRHDRYLDHVPTNRIQSVPRVTPHVRWLNEHIKPNQLVLIVGDAQVFDLQVPFLYSTCFDRSTIDEMLAQPTASARRRWLHDRGITHVVVHWGEIQRYRQPGNYGFSSTLDRDQITLCIENQILRPIPWPILSESADLYEVLSDD